ncbi:hypothetical protein EV127DRAFT_413711 [Xylaria flabelliformis]|nr:hypothetical protein EV127DRAFT_413711 [Xylaria flabelliformis]
MHLDDTSDARDDARDDASERQPISREPGMLLGQPTPEVSKKMRASCFLLLGWAILFVMQLVGSHYHRLYRALSALMIGLMMSQYLSVARYLDRDVMRLRSLYREGQVA